jgi:hypothetical protein
LQQAYQHTVEAFAFGQPSLELALELSVPKRQRRGNAFAFANICLKRVDYLLKMLYIDWLGHLVWHRALAWRALG